MNELTLMTSDQLAIEARNVDRRYEKLQTAEGQEQAAHLMLNILRMIEGAGYNPKSDLADMAMVWVMAMIDQIAAYRFEGIRKAAIEFIRTDSSEYKSFPTAGQMIDICNRIGHNPKAELGRREMQRVEEELIRERDAELASLPDEYKKQCTERFKHLWKGAICG